MSVKLIAFDLDGTITQHKSQLEPENEALLTELSRKYKLLMVGAGQCMRIWKQLREFPIDVIGNYGMQYAEYDPEEKSIHLVNDVQLPCDRDSVEQRAKTFREAYGFTEFAGDSVEFHPSGCVTIALIGTKAKLDDKLAFDPDKSRRRAVYEEVCRLFPDYTVFVGGTSSFDMAPAPYNKYYALDEYCKKNGLSHEEVVYVGDDYGPGGNDESVFNSDFPCVKIDDYRKLGEALRFLR
jgi:HAD superfamily hydrolase (TIGR01484 family)